MKENRDFNWDKVTLKSLKAKLRSIPDMDVPVTLKARLLETIPKKQIKATSIHPVRSWFGIWSFSATAAMVVILILIAILNFGPSVPSRMLVPGPNDSIHNFPNDLNDPSIEDINFVNYDVQQRIVQKSSALLLK